MESLFLGFLNRGLVAGYLVLVILLLRQMFQKAPRGLWLAAWAMVAFRLLSPVSLESPVSLVQSQQPVVIEEGHWEPRIQENAYAETLPERDWTEAPGEESLPPKAETVPAAQPEARALTSREVAVKIGTLVWICGVAALSLGGLFSLVRLRLRVRESVADSEGIFFCDRIDTPFLLGWFRPGIYLPSYIAPEDVDYVVAHEKAHVQRGDPWWKLLGFLLLIAYWFHPLLWAAYILFSRDLEYACDERAVRDRETAWKKNYMQALIRCSVSRRSLTVLAFGEVGVKERVKNIMKYKKPGIKITMIAIVAAVALGMFFLTNQPQQEKTPPAEETLETEARIQKTEAPTEALAENSGLEMYQVSTVDEFLNALGSDREIVLAPGTYELSQASDYGKDTGEDSAYEWLKTDSGYQLDVRFQDDLKIRGSGQGKTEILAVPRDVQVLNFGNCKNLTLEDLTVGHTEGGIMCSGSVVMLNNCRNVNLNRLGLFGCGTIGVETQDVEKLTVEDCEIYECSFAGISANNSSNLLIRNSRIHNLRKNPEDDFPAVAAFSLYHAQKVRVENCEVKDNEVENLIYAYYSDATVAGTVFEGNQPQEAAFWNERGTLMLDGCTFRDNEVRRWYKIGSEKAVDSEGNEITEEMLNPALTEKQPAGDRKQVTASTVDEFLAAIAPNTEIILDGELYDLSTAQTYGKSGTEYYCWEDPLDGPELIITNVDNLTIRTDDGDVKAHTISAVPRYADVLSFRGCSNVTLSGFTAGHTKEPGSCSGGVIYFEDSDHMTVENCGLFGCGILGVWAQYTEDVQVENCEIYECSNGGIRMDSCQNVQVNGCTFRDLGGMTYVFMECQNVLIDGSPFDPSREY